MESIVWTPSLMSYGVFLFEWRACTISLFLAMSLSFECVISVVLSATVHWAKVWWPAGVLAFLWKLPRITKTLPHNSRRSRKLKVSQKDSGDKHSTLLSGRTILVCQPLCTAVQCVLSFGQNKPRSTPAEQNYIGLPTARCVSSNFWSTAAGYINLLLEEWETWWVKTLEIQIHELDAGNVNWMCWQRAIISHAQISRIQNLGTGRI